MTSSAAPMPQPRLSPSLLLAELEAAHSDVRERSAALGAITDSPQPSKMEYTSARLRLSQASIDRRSAVNKIMRFLEQRDQPGDAEAVAKVRDANGELNAHSVAHLAKWPTDSVADDWSGYREASRTMREHMLRVAQLEGNVLRPLLR
ncbi:MAG TPA: hypothetical protein VIK68_10715 [Sphingomicrobium sp.]